MCDLWYFCNNNVNVLIIYTGQHLYVCFNHMFRDQVFVHSCQLENLTVQCLAVISISMIIIVIVIVIVIV